ncbi:MAG: hypothetical protein ACREDL_05250 [Bradyrhizobium sp.]
MLSRPFRLLLGKTGYPHPFVAKLSHEEKFASEIFAVEARQRHYCGARAIFDTGRVDKLNEKQINSFVPTDAMIVAL